MFLAILAVAPAPVTAENRSAKPLPADGVIAESGYYLLEHDCRLERETGITIAADDTTLDLGGHRLLFHNRPRPSSFGIVLNGRKNVRITHGSIGGFWYNLHCIDTRELRIDHLQFEDIPYVAANIGGCRDVFMHANSFSNFRYDIPRPQGERYLIGINITAQNAVLCRNRFELKDANSRLDTPTEAVLMLLGADSERCVMLGNLLEAQTVPAGSYGIWIASNAHACILGNKVHNLKYGACFDTKATALVAFNEFSTGESAVKARFGLYAANADEMIAVGNSFENIGVPFLAPVTAKR